MTIKGLWHQNSNYSASDFRQLQDVMFGGEGVADSASFAKSLPGGNTFRLSAGKIVVKHDATNAGKFVVYSDANIDLTITGPSGTNKRTLVYLQVEDVALDGVGSDVCSIKQASNTGSSPALPTIPSDCVGLYDITILDGQSITAGSTVINDIRPLLKAPWSQPWGVVGVAGPGANTAVSSTETTLLTASVTTVANRRLKLSASLSVLANVTGYHNARIRRSGTQVAISTFRHAAGTIDYSTIPVLSVDTPAAGTYSYTLSVQLASGTGTADGGSTSTYLFIEDIGPNPS